MIMHESAKVVSQSSETVKVAIPRIFKFLLPDCGIWCLCGNKKLFSYTKAKESAVKLLVQENVFLLAHKHHVPQSGRRNLKILGIATFTISLDVILLFTIVFLWSQVEKICLRSIELLPRCLHIDINIATCIKATHTSWHCISNFQPSAKIHCSYFFTPRASMLILLMKQEWNYFSMTTNHIHGKTSHQ